MTVLRPSTFRVDNVLIQNAPKTFGAQLYLPGLAPFGPFDYWATLALYSLLDPENPKGEVYTTYTDLLSVLQFTREVSNAVEGRETYPTYPSDAYYMVEESLQRLFTVEVNWRAEWAVRLTDKTGRPTRGRPKKQIIEYQGRILTAYGLVYPPGVTPPSMQPAAKRENINRAKTSTGEPPPPIWRNKEGPRPQGIVYQLSPQLVRGLTKEDPHIGATILPLRIFGLRNTFGRNPAATRLLVWVCRQTSRNLTRRLDTLADEMNMTGRQKSRNRDALLKAFAMLRDVGVVEGFTVAEDEVGLPTITFTKADDWYFSTGEKRVKSEPPLLEEPKKGGKVTG